MENGHVCMANCLLPLAIQTDGKCIKYAIMVMYSITFEMMMMMVSVINDDNLYIMKGFKRCT